MRDWPHSLRATRLKIIQVAKKQARLASGKATIKKSSHSLDPTMITSSSQGQHSGDVAMDLDTPAYTSSRLSALRQRTPLYRQNSMDFLPIPEEPTAIAAPPPTPSQSR